MHLMKTSLRKSSFIAIITFILLLLFLFWAVNNRFKRSKKLLVTILYESLCPFAQKYVETQVRPTYFSFHDHIDMEFVPFGNSQFYTNGSGLKCSHGSEECNLNLKQLCVLHEIRGNIPKQVNYVSCQMRFTERLNVADGKKCATLANVPWNKIQACVKGVTGRSLILEAEQLTRRYDFYYTPTILFNHVLYPNIDALSRSNLKSVICELINYESSNCKEPFIDYNGDSRDSSSADSLPYENILNDEIKPCINPEKMYSRSPSES